MDKITREYRWDGVQTSGHVVELWKLSARHIILAFFVCLTSLCQKLSELVKIWGSYNENNFACFFLRHGVD